MASEITVTNSLSCKNGGFDMPARRSPRASIDQVTPGGGVPGQITATTGGVDVTVTALGTVGWCEIVNNSASNFVTYGPKLGGTYHPFGKLLPGEAAVFRLDSTVIPSTTSFHVKADTASCKCLVRILEA